MAANSAEGTLLLTGKAKLGELRAEMQGLKKDSRGVQTQTSNTRKEGDQATSSFIAMGKGAAGLLTKLGILALSLKKVGNLIRQVAAESREQNRVFANLTERLGRAGIEYSDVESRLSSFFATLQATTREGDTAVARTMSQIVTMTSGFQPTIEQIETWTELSLDMAEAMKNRGMSLATATELVGRAVGGELRNLQRLLPVYRDQLRDIAKLETAHERSAAAVELLSQQFGGARENLHEYDLASARLANGMEDVREAVGDFFTESAGVLFFLEGLVAAVDSAAVGLQGLGQAFRDAGGAISSRLTEFLVWAKAVDAVVDVGAGRSPLDAMFTVSDDTLRSLERFDDALHDLQNSTDEWDQDLRSTQEAIADIARDFVESSTVMVTAGGFTSEMSRELFRQYAGAEEFADLTDFLMREVYPDVLRVLEDGIASGASLTEIMIDLDAATRGWTSSLEGFGGSYLPVTLSMGDTVDILDAAGNRIGQVSDRAMRLVHGPLRDVQELLDSLFGVEEPDDDDRDPRRRDRKRALNEEEIEQRNRQIIAAKSLNAEERRRTEWQEYQRELSDALVDLEEELKLKVVEAAALEEERTLAGVLKLKELRREGFEEKAAMLEEEKEREIQAALEVKEAWFGAIDAIANFAADGFSKMGEAMVGAGKDSQKGGKVILSMLGDLASSVGRMYFLAGIPMIIPGPHNAIVGAPQAGAALMGSGAALMTLGGVLGGVANRGGGTPAGPSSTGIESDSSGASRMALLVQNYFADTTFVSDDPETTRKMMQRFDQQRLLGGLEAW